MLRYISTRSLLLGILSLRGCQVVSSKHTEDTLLLDTLSREERGMPSSKLLLCLISLMREMRHNKTIVKRRWNFFLPWFVRDSQDRAKRKFCCHDSLTRQHLQTQNKQSQQHKLLIVLWQHSFAWYSTNQWNTTKNIAVWVTKMAMQIVLLFTLDNDGSYLVRPCCNSNCVLYCNLLCRLQKTAIGCPT